MALTYKVSNQLADTVVILYYGMSFWVKKIISVLQEETLVPFNVKKNSVPCNKTYGLKVT